MIILGIDPGTYHCGYGVIEIDKKKIVAAACGEINAGNEGDLAGKLVFIYHNVKRIISEYKPTAAAVETIFYGKNVKSAFTLGHARGVIMLALAEAGLPVDEYSPREIKKAVVGNGNAAKEQVQFMVQRILNLKNQTITPDSADALAVAMCKFHKHILG